METANVGKVHKQKRNKELAGMSTEEGNSLKHKRIRTSNSDDTEAPLSMSTEQQEEMLQTVSGHVRELVTKERRLTDPSDRNKGRSKSKNGKGRTKSSKTHEKDKEAGKQIISNGAAVSPTEDGEGGTCVSAGTTGVSQESALEYLRLWKEERERWSFKKKTQYWLLQNMYDRTKVPKASFKNMLRYLEGLSGHQRDLSKQKAQKIVEQYGEEDLSPPVSRRHYKRAVAIMRVLG